MKKCSILMILLVFFSLGGCTAKGHNTAIGIGTEEVEEAKMLFVNIPYTARMALSVAINQKGIANQYGEPTEVISNGNRKYESRSISDGSKLIVVYEDGRMIDMWQLKALLSRNQFDAIKIDESTLEDVLSIDPYTTLIENDKQGTSEHRLEDGTAVISYSKNSDASEVDWVVQNIEFDDNDYSGFSKDDIVRNLINGN